MTIEKHELCSINYLNNSTQATNLIPKLIDLKMLAGGINLDIIAKITGCSIEQIQSLQS